MKEITTEAKIEKINRIQSFVQEFLEKIGCPKKAQMQIDLALDELITNIANYAYPGGDGPVTIRVEEEKEPEAVVVSILDSGIPFDPLAKKDPDLSLSAEERSIGGLGIFLVKKSMDEVRYARENGQNILRLRKFIRKGREEKNG